MTGDFLDARPELAHIRDFARSRRTNPASTLAVALVRASCMIRPGVVLPPIIGGAVAPNLFAALVGESGGGKGASDAAGRDAIRYTVEDPDLPEFSPGSGEGIARVLMGDPTALFVAPEIDTLAALFSRKGQTLQPELRKLYMGERLGFANANKDTRTKVDALWYRAGLIVGVQPLRAGALLDGRDGGTPQRFLWAPTRDRDMPIDRPPPMEPLDVFPPYWPGGLHELTVCPVARAEIERRYVDYHRGESDADLLDGHALLTRLKVAAALMVLAGRSEVTDEDWELAGHVMAISTATRESVARAAEEQRHRRVIGRAAEAVERDEYIGDSKLRRAKRAILRKLDKLADDEPISHSELRRALKSDVRDEFDPAITELTDEGRAVKVALDRGYGYWGSTRPPLGHPISPADSGVDLGVSPVPDPQHLSWGNAEPAPVTDASIAKAIALAREHASKQRKTR
jgi:hypothetical protein